MAGNEFSMPTCWSNWEIVRSAGRDSFSTYYEIRSGEDMAQLRVIPAADATTAEQMAEEFRRSALCEDVQCVPSEEGTGWNVCVRSELLPNMMKSMPASPEEEQIIRLGKDICNALIQCHNSGVLHRDIKPKNVFVNPDGSYRLGNFCPAALAEQGDQAEKAAKHKHYAPEIYGGQPHSASSDVYSLGLLMYWILNRRRTPFLPMPPQKPTLPVEEEALLRRVSGEAIPVPAQGSPELQQIVLKACAFEVSDRYDSPEQMLEDLEKLTEEPVPVVVIPEIPKAAPDAVPEPEVVPEPMEIQPEPAEISAEAMEAHRQAVLIRRRKRRARRRKIGVIIGGLVLIPAMILGTCYFTVHFWTEAGCMEMPVCKICGKEKGDMIAHAWTEASCTAPKTCRLCGREEGTALGHTWTEATCTAPRVCRACGETQGEPTEHLWEDATCTAPKVCRACGETQGEPAEHLWEDATCMTPKICRNCGKTEGEKAEHIWTEATCETPEICQVCGAEGESGPGHRWTDATYTAPETCQVCGKTQGEPRGYPLILCNDTQTSNPPGSNPDVAIGSWLDATGVPRDEAIQFWVADYGNYSPEEYIVFEIAPGYRRMDFLMVAGADSEPDTKAKIMIYADGRLIYESDPIRAGAGPIEESVDISGASRIRILCTTDSKASCYCIFKAALYK